MNKNRIKGKENREIVVLSAKQILLYLADLTVAMHSVFDSRKLYKKPMKAYWKWRGLDKNKFSKELYRLKQRKIIRVYQENKEKYIELTPEGLKKVKLYQVQDMKLEAHSDWDQRWRIVIFDIPNDKKDRRDLLRDKLKRLGFIKMQESVFIYPFECKSEIDFICEYYFIKPYAKYIVADFFEGDDKIITHFLNENILSRKMINNIK